MSLLLYKVTDNRLYEDSVDFEVIPKMVLNDGNLIIKIKTTSDMIDHIGSIQHYQVGFVHFILCAEMLYF